MPAPRFPDVDVFADLFAFYMHFTAVWAPSTHPSGRFYSKHGSTQIPRHPDIRISPHPEIRIYGKPDTRKSGHPNFLLSGHPDLRICRYPDIGYAVFRISGDADVRICGLLQDTDYRQMRIVVTMITGSSGGVIMDDLFVSHFVAMFFA